MPLFRGHKCKQINIWRKDSSLGRLGSLNLEEMILQKQIWTLCLVLATRIWSTSKGSVEGNKMFWKIDQYLPFSNLEWLKNWPTVQGSGRSWSSNWFHLFVWTRSGNCIHLPLSLFKLFALYICKSVSSCHPKTNKLLDTSSMPSTQGFKARGGMV